MKLKVTVVASRLKIRLPKYLFDGCSKDFYLGLTDSPSDIVRAEKIALLIEHDILNECFDKSLEKYRSEFKLFIGDLIKLWLEYRKPYWDNSTFKNKQYLCNEINAFFPNYTSISFRDAVDFSKHLLRNYPKPDTFNRKIDTLIKCWDWLINMDYVCDNPWLKIDKLHNTNKNKPKPRPFTKNGSTKVVM